MSKHKEREAKFWKRARRVSPGKGEHEKTCPTCQGDGHCPTCRGQGCEHCWYIGDCQHCQGNGMVLQ